MTDCKGMRISLNVVSSTNFLSILKWVLMLNVELFPSTWEEERKLYILISLFTLNYRISSFIQNKISLLQYLNYNSYTVCSFLSIFFLSLFLSIFNTSPYFNHSVFFYLINNSRTVKWLKEIIEAYNPLSDITKFKQLCK